MKTILFLLIVTALFFVYSCSKSTPAAPFTEDCSVAKTFTADANPVIQSFCATNSGCHGSGSTNGPGNLSTYQQIFDARAAIRSAVISGSMPQNSTLSSSQKNAIVCWIDNGASNN